MQIESKENRMQRTNLASEPDQGMPLKSSVAGGPPKARSTKKGVGRQRASTACRVCRHRRVRCVVDAAETQCRACKQLEVPCMFPFQDLRRTPHSRVHTENLNKHISTLEHILEANGIEFPRLDIPTLSSSSIPKVSSTISETASYRRQFEYIGWLRLLGSFATPGPSNGPKPHYLDETFHFISIETDNHLMHLFWSNFNTVLPVLRRHDFEEHKRDNSPVYYSKLLHTCMMAIGYRYADRKRAGIQDLELPGRESLFHRQAKNMVEKALEEPPQVAMIVALLLLSDLEWAVGREKQGWLMGRMAIRTAVELGLHRDDGGPHSLPLCSDIRLLTLQACIQCDQMWSLLLGQTAGMQCLSLDSEPEIQLSATRRRSTKELTHRTFAQLLDVTCKSIGRLESKSPIDVGHFLELSHSLEEWRNNLPEELECTPDNIEEAPAAFFLLHQQYHASMISVCLSFARFKDQLHSTLGSGDASSQSGCSAIASEACTRHALWITRILQLYRRRFRTQNVFIICFAHAGMAAKGLLLGLRCSIQRSRWDELLHHLKSLLAILSEMTQSFEPAERMRIALQVELDAFLKDRDLQKCDTFDSLMSASPETIKTATSDIDDQTGTNSVPSYASSTLDMVPSPCPQRKEPTKTFDEDITGIEISTDSWRVLMQEINVGLVDGSLWGVANPDMTDGHLQNTVEGI